MWGGMETAREFTSPERRERQRSPRRADTVAGALFQPGWAGAQQQQQQPTTFPMNSPNVGMTEQQQVATEAAVTQLAAGVLTNEEIIIRLEVHAGHVAPALASVEAQVHGLTNTVHNSVTL